MALFAALLAFGATAQTVTYNADDQLSTETYDANGNTLSTGGKTFAYDSENHLVLMNGGAVTLAYDGDGNLFSKTVNGVTTKFLIDDMNPAQLPQVMEEIVNGAVQRRYNFGRQRISQTQLVNNSWVTSVYGYDGQENVRQLTNAAGVVTDTYDYDAFGNLINHTGTTPNNYLYRGELYDPDLGLYYLRARWYNPVTGRFMSRDPKGPCNCSPGIPSALHAYNYASSDPVNRVDPRGRTDTVEEEGVIGEIDLTQVGRATVPKGAFWGGIGLTGFGLQVACLYNTEGAGVGAVGQNLGSPQNPKLLPAICSAISSKMPYKPRPGAVPSPLGYPSLESLTAPGGPPWHCGELGPDDLPDECWAPCANGKTEKLHYDPGTTNGKGAHWDYTDCNGDTWYIWPDGTMTPAT